MDSIWMETTRLPQFEALEQNAATDVLIIGGGLAGLLCANMLQKSGADYMLVEAKRICSGITKGTTAKITAQHGLIYDKLAGKYGVETARLYLQANLEALDCYRAMCREIDCDFQEQDNVVYSLQSREKTERELEALRRIGYTEAFAPLVKAPIVPAEGAVCFPRQAQFHPLKFAAAIAKELRIFENTKVQELKPGKAVTNRGTISAKKIIVATHFPFLNKHGSYFLKLYQHRSYVLALKQVPQVERMYVDEAKDGLSFRQYGDVLLLGGGGHRTGKKGGGWQELEVFAKRSFPQAVEVCRWAVQDCMTLDGMPYIGQYSRRMRDLYVATGFHKWGMTSAMAAAALLTDLVQGRENRYAGVFSPSRTMLHPQLLINAGESALHLLTPTVPRCPHMGCALKYNPEEHSWDCPCHGSRFTEDGEVIDNPATDDKRKEHHGQ